MFWIILSILLLICVIFLGYDHIDTLKNWLGRIKIGSAGGREAWRGVIIKWLDKGAPAVPVDENKSFKLIDDIKSIGKVSTTAYWQDAAVLKAATAMDGDYIHESIAILTEKYTDPFSGEWKTEPQRVDCAMLAYEMLCCPHVDNSLIEPAAGYVADMLTGLAEEYGTVPYNRNVPDVRFVDTVGMICPFLIKYAEVYKKTDCIDIAMRQIKEYNEYGLNENGIPIHCFSKESREPLGIYGWGRGCAWWALGLTDSLRSLLKLDGFNSEKAYLLKKLLAFLDKMIGYQRPDGSFGRMLFTDSLRDSSAAAMLAYCFKYAYSLTKDEKYRDAAEKALDNLLTCTRRNGVIDYSQGDTGGIGFYSNSLSVIPAAQGFAVAADIL